MSLIRFGRDQNGSVLVEVTILIPIIFIFLLGAVDFLLLFYQWNAAAKAVETGARIAALIDPVATNLDALSTTIPSGGQFGDAVGDYQVICDGNTSTCTCTGTCTGWSAGYDQTAMNWIVFGRGQTSGCGDATSNYFAGMCDIFGRITPAYVVVTYTQSGLGFVGRRPVPTITVSLQNLPYQYFFLGWLFGSINIPAQATTETGEALSSAQP